ncbi:META domain-containing protein [Phyllobacterium lublinensis]|uniref:META domain-containing protein n=1 Tax=Phyllobacterium lublinensis TaxID=2875708 RepID=UPI001CC97014|nr:META domain-containing protein [Phyllobacterium sp. 2063]MBZ9655155.1 META domain-containing protein [Phyllobacterium sp. 2063]
MNRIAVGSLIIGFVAVLALLVMSLSARSDEPTDVNWLAEDIGGGVIDYAQTTLMIKSDGSVSGSGGCNRFMTSASIDGSKITFKPAAATRMMCAPALMDQEQKFFSALEQTRSFAIDSATKKLLLHNADGKITARLARQD